MVGERSETRRVLPHLQHAGVDALSDDNSRTAVGAARAGARGMRARTPGGHGLRRESAAMTMSRRAASALLLAAACAFAPPKTHLKRATTQLYFFDKLAESITAATDVLSGKSRMTEANTKSALRDVRRSLLDADDKKLGMGTPLWPPVK